MMRPADEVVFQRDGFQCVYCGFDGSTFAGWVFLQVDHFTPKSLAEQMSWRTSEPPVSVATL
jgi:5-methylcytosine-specific restriction endonuclease McrA